MIINLFEVDAWNPDAGPAAEETLYFSDAEYTGTGPQPYNARLKSVFSFKQSMINGDLIGGEAHFSLGEVKIINSDGDLDQYKTWAVDGREIRIKQVDSAGTVTTIFTGFAANWHIAEREATVFVKDKSIELEQSPASATTYDGGNINSSDTKGDDAVEAKPKPACYGEVKNVKAVKINHAGRIYQVHGYGAISAIDDVYDKGVQLTLTTDYTVNLTNGTFTLTGAPAGQITADVKGDATGSGYVNKTADIIERILDNHTNLGSDIDTTSFSDLNTDQGSEVGIYINEIGADAERDIETVADAISTLMQGIGGYWGYNKDGNLAVGVFKAPAATADFTVTDDKIKTIQRKRAALPAWRQRVAYDRNWTVQRESDLASSVSEERVLELSEPWKLVEDSDTAVQTKHKLALDPEPIPGYFRDKADAETEASRVRQLFDDDVDVFDITIKEFMGDVELNQTGSFTDSRFGLSSGKKMVVTAFDKNKGKDETKLTVWG